MDKVWPTVSWGSFVRRKGCETPQVGLNQADWGGLARRHTMTDLSAYVFSVLREGQFTLYRGTREGLAPVVLVAPAGEYPSLGSLRRLEHGYALRADLHPDWA